jgi:hypothetical protein
MMAAAVSVTCHWCHGVTEVLTAAHPDAWFPVPAMKIKREEAFSVLELQEGASEDEIKRSFKKLALKW